MGYGLIVSIGTGSLTQILDPLGGVQKFLYDETGRATLELDQNQNATRIVYDQVRAPIAKISPLGYRISIPEDPNEAHPRAHRVAANPAEYEYGRLFDGREILCGMKHRCRRCLCLTREEGHRCSRRSTRDAHAGTEVHRAPARNTLVGPLPVEGRIFNEFGKLVQQHDEFGRMRHWSYDASGNVCQYVDFDGGKWSYEYRGGTWFVNSPIRSEPRLSSPILRQKKSPPVPMEGVPAVNIVMISTTSSLRLNAMGSCATYQRDACGNLSAKTRETVAAYLNSKSGPAIFQSNEHWPQATNTHFSTINQGAAW